MRRCVTGLLSAIALFGSGASAQPSPESAVLEVRFYGLEDDAGKLIYAVYEDESSFESGEGPLAAGSLAIGNGEAEWTADLPRGVYAVKAYHDVNGNGELDRGAFGRPTEPYGFSRDARARFGPPAWKAARFKLDAARKRIEIRLH